MCGLGRRPLHFIAHFEDTFHEAPLFGRRGQDLFHLACREGTNGLRLHIAL
jgi:hypothetical protein